MTKGWRLWFKPLGKRQLGPANTGDGQPGRWVGHYAQGYLEEARLMRSGSHRIKAQRGYELNAKVITRGPNAVVNDAVALSGCGLCLLFLLASPSAAELSIATRVIRAQTLLSERCQTRGGGSGGAWDWNKKVTLYPGRAIRG